MDIPLNCKYYVIYTVFSPYIFTEWLAEAKHPSSFETLSAPELDIILGQFYASAKPIKSPYYSKSTYTNLRASINRHLRLPPHNRQINIMKDPEFQLSNQIYIGILKKLRAEGKDTTKHKDAIPSAHLEQIYRKCFDISTGCGLLRKVFFEVSLHFVRRGREGLRELKPEYFSFKTDSKGAEYVTMDVHEREKTKQGHEKTITEKSPRMYAQAGDPRCPVHSLRKYIKKRNQDCPAFYQYPSKNVTEDNPVWFDRKPLGKNALGGMMKTISEKAGLPVTYTNHCIRATAITILSDADVESNDIITMTGHKSTESLRQYKVPSEEKRQLMSNLLHKSKCTNIESNSITTPTMTPSNRDCGPVFVLRDQAPRCETVTSTQVSPVVRVPDVSAPYDHTPDVSAPYDHTPDVSAPYDHTPNVSAPYDHTPDVSAPYDHTPDVSAPYDHTPDVSAPYVRAPHVSAPYVRAPHVSTPYVRAPHVPTPYVRAPHVPTPYVRAPHVSAPYVRAPHVPTPYLRAPDVPAVTPALPTDADTQSAINLTFAPSSQSYMANAPHYLSGMFNGANISGNIAINFNQYHN